MNRPLKLAIIAGEESGELLAADLVEALKAQSGRDAQLVGVGGRHLAALGLTSMFPSGDIALMGVSAVVRDLPRLIARIGSTARAIVAEQPDCVVTVDSPEFNLRVAAKIRAMDAAIPIVHYVCPSVWAWRPGRAAAMRPNIDRVLCILPFEVGELARLGGPPGTFVGHRLMRDEGVMRAASAQEEPRDLLPGTRRTLLLLPGSRKGEVRSLLEPFRETVEILIERGRSLRLLLPTVPHVADIVREETGRWPLKPEILVGADAKWDAFAEADAALIASGTVSLELALCGVPMISTYKLDLLARFARSLVTAWSASLPNLIADRVVVPEYIDEMLRPHYVARQLEALMDDTDLRRWQKSGFAEVHRRMQTDRPSREIAAQAVLEAIEAGKK
ncbi:MAG: lipid-A-disaccharide synthase [Rhizobiaceae bacterium]|nr:lipid-A-disaccharide synthase [Rhizobiaceae bacterium]